MLLPSQPPSSAVFSPAGQASVPPVGFLHFDDPPGDVHIKYGSITDDEHWVMKIASGFYDNPSLGISPSDGVILVFSQRTGALELVLHEHELLSSALGPFSCSEDDDSCSRRRRVLLGHDQILPLEF